MDKEKIVKATVAVACGLVVGYIGYQTYQFVKDERKRKAEKSAEHEDLIKKEVEEIHDLNRAVVKELYDKAVKTVRDKGLKYLIADMHNNPDKYPDVNLTDEISVYEKAASLLDEFSGEFIEQVSKEHYRLMTKDL